jgi:hypothetical protein
VCVCGGGGGGGGVVGTLAYQQIVFWDEIHIKCFVGSCGHDGKGHNMQVTFPRAASGAVDENGTHADPKPENTFKHQKVRFVMSYITMHHCAA